MFNKDIIYNNLSKLTKQEKVVAEFAANKGFELINMSINEILKETNTSLATINRTFSKMGFTGFKYYKMFLFSNLKTKPNTSDELEFQKTHLLLSIENAYSNSDYDELDKIAKLIIKNKQSITIISEGFNYFVAKIFASKLNKIGFETKFFDDSLYSGVLSNSLVIIFSSNINNESLFKKLNILKSNNPKIEIILITNSSNVKNKYDYDYVISVPFIDNFRMNQKELPSDSLVLMLVMCNLIFDRIYLKNKNEYATLIEKIKW